MSPVKNKKKLDNNDVMKLNALKLLTKSNIP